MSSWQLSWHVTLWSQLRVQHQPGLRASGLWRGPSGVISTSQPLQCRFAFLWLFLRDKDINNHSQVRPAYFSTANKGSFFDLINTSYEPFVALLAAAGAVASFVLYQTILNTGKKRRRRRSGGGEIEWRNILESLTNPMEKTERRMYPSWLDWVERNIKYVESPDVQIYKYLTSRTVNLFQITLSIVSFGLLH